MQQAMPMQDVRTEIDRVPDPQILPVSFIMPLATARFASPAASPCMTQNLLDLLLRKK